MAPTSAIGHDGKPIQQTLVILVTTSTLSPPNSYSYSDAKNVRECNKPTVQLCADASVTLFPRWIKNYWKRKLRVIMCVWTLRQKLLKAQTAGNNVRVDTSTSLRIQSVMKLLQQQHVWCWSQQPKRLRTGILCTEIFDLICSSSFVASTRQRIPTHYQVSQFNHRALPVTMQNAWFRTGVPVWNP